MMPRMAPVMVWRATKASATSSNAMTLVQHGLIPITISEKKEEKGWGDQPTRRSTLVQENDLARETEQLHLKSED